MLVADIVQEESPLVVGERGRPRVWTSAQWLEHFRHSAASHLRYVFRQNWISSASWRTSRPSAVWMERRCAAVILRNRFSTNECQVTRI